MRALFLTYCYPPLRYPRSIQISRLVKFLDHPVRVVCAAGRAGEPIDPTIAGTDERSHDIRRLSEAGWQQLLHRYRDLLLPQYWGIPDANRSWALRAAGTILTRKWVEEMDLLVTFGQPMSTHLAGFEIKRQTGIPWMAHFSDPWVDNPLDGSRGMEIWLKRRMEHAVMEQVDGAVFTSAETVDLVMAKYPLAWRHKVGVVPHGFDPDPFPACTERCPGEPVVLRYLGNFYGNRTPHALFQALEHLIRQQPKCLEGVRVELYGDFSPTVFARTGLQSMISRTVTIHRPVTYQKSLELMASADLLLVLDAPAQTSVFLPSKLVDYIGSGRPILGLTPPGAAASLIQSMGGWVGPPDNPEQAAKALSQAIAWLQNHHQTLPWGQESVRQRYHARHVAHQMADLMLKVTRKEPLLPTGEVQGAEG
ncbi:MAG: glycosyltransferase [Magnetococcales bacterium]|nr:glycosyltransferase [Magnetococcales bacterium]